VSVAEAKAKKKPKCPPLHFRPDITAAAQAYAGTFESLVQLGVALAQAPENQTSDRQQFLVPLILILLQQKNFAATVGLVNNMHILQADGIVLLNAGNTLLAEETYYGQLLDFIIANAFSPEELQLAQTARDELNGFIVFVQVINQ
jgi:hypothetical protein